MFKQQLAPSWKHLDTTSLAAHRQHLQQLTEHAIAAINQGDLDRWLAAYDDLPEAVAAQWLHDQDAVTVQWSHDTQDQLRDALQRLQPWRKGPFDIGGVAIDAEWRSNLKWTRLLPHLPVLQNRTVLDVGCGNGYYLFRMAEQNPELVVGIEPGILQNVQFWAAEKYVQSGALMWPLKVQAMPHDLRCFDVVFSMGVLYHRKSPIEHLEHLRSFLSPGGHLVLETLVVDGDEQSCLVPVGRYAQMRNVWFLPSPAMLSLWLEKLGFKNIQVVDLSLTTTDEQRRTEWMQYHSLAEFLQPDMSQTIEGHAPPQRVIITCQK